MSIIKCFIRWWVWWGENTFYYYSRPFVWLWLGAPVVVGCLDGFLFGSVPTLKGRKIIYKESERLDRLTDHQLINMLYDARRRDARWEVFELQRTLNSPRRVAERYFGA